MQDKEIPLEAEVSNGQQAQDNFEVHPGQEFHREWTFKNTGAWQWPAGVKLMLTEGDKLATNYSEQMDSVQPNEEHVMVVYFKAPEEAGNYICYFRLISEGNFFGPKVWCNIVVQEEDRVIAQVENAGAADQIDDDIEVLEESKEESKEVEFVVPEDVEVLPEADVQAVADVEEVKMVA